MLARRTTDWGNRTMRAVSALACGLLVWTAPLAAHHSFAAEYDGSQPITVTGTVAKVDWQNPHIYLYLDVKDAQGTVAQWKFEGCSGMPGPMSAASSSV